LSAEQDAALRGIVKLLNQAEPKLTPGIGKPRTEQGMKFVEEASNELERLAPSQLPRDVAVARADALRQLDKLTGRG
jgi:hypothetical protein